MIECATRNMSPNIIHSQPKFGIYGFDNGPKPDPDIIKSSGGFNRQVRLPHFEQKQNMQSIDLILDIEGVGTHPKEKLVGSFSPRSLHFTVEDLEGEDVHLIIPRLAHEISPTQSCVTVKNKNTVVITLSKIKSQIWKTVYYNTDLVKKLWAQNMREFVQTIIDHNDVASVLKEIWNQAQIICTDDLSFFLNAPTPFGPMQSIQGANSIDEVIDRLKASITNRNDLFVKAFFLGAAVLYKLRDHDEEFKETDHTSGNESESASSNMEEENLTSIEARLKKIALMNVPERKAFANRKKEIGNKHLRAKRYTVAIRYYSEAIDLYPENPVFYSNRSTCNFILKNYDESFEDACKAIDLDPLFDQGFYRAFKALAALELPQLANLVANLALEFDRENRKDFTKLMLGGNFGLTSSPSETDETTESYVKSDLRLKQMENFEKIRKVNREFEEKKDYEKVMIMARELLQHSKTPTVANGYYYLSFSSYNLNEREAAFNYIEKCLTLTTDHAPAKRLKECLLNFYSYKDNGFINFVQGKYQDCLTWYKKGLSLVNENINHSASFHFLIGLTKKAQKKSKDAIKSFSQAIELKPDFMHAYFLRGECFQILGRSQEAQSNFSTAVELYKNEINFNKPSEAGGEKNLKTWRKEIDQSFLRKASSFYESGNLETGAEYYKLAVLCHPNDAQIHCESAAALRKVHRFEEALSLANKAVEINPNLGTAYFEKGVCLLVLGYVERAISSLENAQRLLPDDKEVKAEMGRALTLRVFLKRGNDAMEKADFQGAEMYLMEARNIAYLDIALKMELTKCQKELEMLNNAATPEIQEVYNVPDNSNCVVSDELQLIDSRCPAEDIPIADTYCIMGACAYHQGNKEEALSHFQKALEHDSHHIKAKEAIQVVEHVFSAFEKACDLLSLDNLKEAEMYFKMGTSLDDENSHMKAKFHHGLGLTYFKMNELEKAIHEFSSAINNDGDFADAYMKRGDCYQALNNYPKAIEDFKSAVELDPAPEYKSVLKVAQKHYSRNC